MILLLALALTTPLAPTPAPVITGDFRSPTQAIVRLYACGADMCLKLVQLPPDAPTNVDHNNPDKSLRTRPLCGLDIGIHFHRDDATHLSGGQLYDPKTGHTYKGTIVMEGDTLKLHGYLGFYALGRTEEWKRVATMTSCK